MALNATIFSFEINLSDSDREVYQSLTFRAARHPSESDPFLVTRVLAYALEYCEGLTFSKGGLSDPDSPALAVYDLTGVLRRWVEVGTPEPARLHRASKASPQVAVYPHRDVELLLRRLGSERIHRAENIEIYAIEPAFIEAVSARLARRMTFDLVVSEKQLYLSLGEETLTGTVVRHAIPEAQ